jgi:hydroxypyruvate isomerase
MCMVPFARLARSMSSGHPQLKVRREMLPVGEPLVAKGGRTMQLSVCIEMIGREVPFEERIALAAQAGYPAVEFWSWANKDIAAIKRLCAEHGVKVAGFVGINKLVNPGDHADMLANLRAAIDVARQLECPTLIATTGNERSDASREEQRDAVVAGLKAAAPLAEDAGITLVLEPLNILVDHKGYYLATSTEGFDIIRAVGSPHVRLLFDIYHQQITEGNVTANLTKNVELIGHIHVADVPGRHEPGTGELNYRNIFRALAQAGYKRYIGLEFAPTGPSLPILQQVRELLP